MADNGIVSIICIVMYIFTSTLNYMSIPFAMISEVFLSKITDILSGVTVAINFVISAIMIKIYSDMRKLLDMHSVSLFRNRIFSWPGIHSIVLDRRKKKNKKNEIEDMFSKKKKSFKLQATEKKRVVSTFDLYFNDNL